MRRQSSAFKTELEDSEDDGREALGSLNREITTSGLKGLRPQVLKPERIFFGEKAVSQAGQKREKKLRFVIDVHPSVSAINFDKSFPYAIESGLNNATSRGCKVWVE